jgi:hypothetical protein
MPEIYLKCHVFYSKWINIHIIKIPELHNTNFMYNAGTEAVPRNLRYVKGPL